MIGTIFFVFSSSLLHNCLVIRAHANDGENSVPGIQTIDEIIASEPAKCGNYALQSGEYVDFQTPNFPGKYPKDYKCTWRFTCPSENSAMEVKCEKFELEANHICFTDYLEIFNNYKSLGKYCRKESPNGLIINSNYMKAVFHSNWDRITRAGFKCNVKCKDKQKREMDMDENKMMPVFVPPMVPCGTYVMDPDDTMTLSSKNFPKSYSKNQKCTWRFTCSSSNSDMRLHCDTFELQKKRTCNGDYLQIFSDVHSLGKYCGKNGPTYLNSDSNYMKLHFRSNGDRITRKGFHCILKCKEKMEMSGLPLVARHNNGQIVSHAEKNQKSNAQDFVDSVLEDLAENSQNIVADKNDLVLPILEVNNTLTTIINKLAAYPKLEEVSSYFEKNVVDPKLQWIGQLVSKVHSSKVAAEAVECGSHLIKSGDKIYFRSPNYPNKYPKSYRCTWDFNCAQESSIIEMNCDDLFELQKNPECHTDYIAAFDKSGSEIKRHCGKDAPKGLISNSNFLSVVFRTNWDKIRRAGFSCNVMCTGIATTTAKPAENPIVTTPPPPLPCGKHTIEPSKTVYFESVNYPDKYKHNETCRWRFTCSAMSSMIEVDCPDFHVESDPDCTKDFLKIKDPYGNLGLYCGDKGPSNLQSYSNYIKIYFISDHEKRKTGFRCSVRCTEIVTTTIDTKHLPISKTVV